MKKATLSATTLPIALLLFSMVIIAFIVVPNIQDVSNAGDTSSFWGVYGYDVGNSTLVSFDMSKNVTDMANSISCDILGKQNATDCPKSTSGTDFINLMVKGGYGALVTLVQGIGFTNILFVNMSTILHIPAQMVGIIQTIVILIILFSILFLIFNRSDV